MHVQLNNIIMMSLGAGTLGNDKYNYQKTILTTTYLKSL